MKTLILLAVICFLLPGELEAVTSCYQCVSSKKCDDPLDLTIAEPTNCAYKTDWCKKKKEMKDNISAVIRSCSIDACTPKDETNVLGIRTIISCCTTDNCNAGAMTQFSITLIMTSLLMVFYKLLL